MLYTRCPECDTTFRITDGALQQARGQVRCGRCAHIFNAHDSLSDRLVDDENDPADIPTDNGRTALPVTPYGGDDADPGTKADTGATAGPPAATDTDAVTTGPETDDGEAQPPPEKQTRGPQNESPDEPPEAAIMSADEIDAVLDGPPAVATPDWIVDGADDLPPRRRGLWTAAACLMLACLGIQLIHVYRSDIARSPAFGPVVQSAYGLFGSEVVPNWDLSRYELLDWAAVEDATAQAGRRNLVIRSRLRNSGDSAQPYPLVHLRLLDRWEDAVGARLFEPGEYIGGTRRSTTMMQPGEIVDAELVIVDPGADTYGFELAVCLQAHGGVVCDTDATFR